MTKIELNFGNLQKTVTSVVYTYESKLTGQDEQSSEDQNSGRENSIGADQNVEGAQYNMMR